MTTRNQVLALAASQIGYTERGGSNGRSGNVTKYWAELKPSYQGGAWCAAFVVWVLKQCGSTLLLDGPSAPYYTPSMEAWAKKNGRWKASKDCQPGDVLIFGGSSHATHTGFLVAQDGPNYVITIEGNTSAGSSGSQTNGGGVYRRRRPRSWVRGCISLAGEYTIPGKTGPGMSVGVPGGSPLTSKPTAGPTEPRGPFPLPRGHWYGRNGWTNRSHSGVRAADRGAIRLIQAKLGFKGKQVDGEYGPATERAVIAWQRKFGLGIDGKVGPATWRSM